MAFKLDVIKIKGHFYEFEWLLNDIGSLSGEICSPEFTIDSECKIKWIVIAVVSKTATSKNHEELYDPWNNLSSRVFNFSASDQSSSVRSFDIEHKIKVGLRRTDSSSIGSVKANLFWKTLNICGHETSCAFPKKDSTLFSEEVLWFSTNSPVTFVSRNAYMHTKTETYTKACIKGTVTTTGCCNNECIWDKNIVGLQNDLAISFKNKQGTDAVLKVDNDVIPVHRFILSARSPVFRNILEDSCKKEIEVSPVIVEYGKAVLEQFLLFLYCGALKESDTNTLFALYSMSVIYEVQTLRDTCRNILKTHITEQSVPGILNFADGNDDQELKEIATTYVCENFLKIEEIPEWYSLVECNPKLASSVLRRVSKNLKNK